MTGKIEVVAFPEAYGKSGAYLREGQLVWIKGKYLGEGESRRISLTQALPLAEAFEKQAKRVVVRIFLPGLEEAVLAELKRLLDGHAGRCPLVFELAHPHSFRLTAQSAEVQRVTPSEALIQKIAELLGDDAVSVDY